MSARARSGATGLRELWAYRELVFFLAWRDVRVRYKQTALGVAWAVLQPLLAMAIFTVFLGRLAKVPSDGVPYPAFAFCGLVVWQIFSHSLADAGNSLVANKGLVTKVYFPRLAIPIAAVLSSLVDFAISFVLLIGFVAYFQLQPTLALVAFPIFLMLAIATSLGVGLWLAALNVRFRDVKYTIPFLTQFWLFATPIAYPASLVPGAWRIAYGLNPMVGAVEGMRWAVLGTGSPAWGTIAVSAATTLLLVVSGLLYFRRVERTFADII